MTEKEANDLLRLNAIDKNLLDIKVYNHNQPYPFIEKKESVVVSAAVELTFENSQFSFFWNEEDHIFSFTSEPLTVHPDWDDLEMSSIETYGNLAGKKIVELECNWTYFQQLDENFEIMEEKLYVPQEIILHFDDNSQLQIACVDYKIDPQSQDLIDLSFHMNGGILVSPAPYKEIAASAFEDF